MVELDEPWVVRERKLLLRDIDAPPGCARELIAQIQESRDESGDTARPDEAVRASAAARCRQDAGCKDSGGKDAGCRDSGCGDSGSQAASGKIPRSAKAPLKSR